VSAVQATDETARAAAPRKPPEADVSALLYLGSPAARILVAIFVASNAAFTVATADVLRAPWQSYLAMVLVSGASVLLVRRHPDPFPLRDTAAILAVVTVSTILVATNLPGDGELGRATWHLGSNTWLLFILTLRRRALLAWLGMALMTAITVAWGVESGRGAITGALMLDTHIGILLVATLFASTLRATARRIASFERRQLGASAQQARNAAAEEIRRTRAAELARAAVPQLERIAGGGPFTSDERESFIITEAALRDSVRGRSLMVPGVAEAAAAARSRGASITILDDRGALPPDGEAVERITAACIGALSAAERGRVTLRLVPVGREAVLTIVAVDGDRVSRVTLGPDGRETD